eukprot:8536479-Heterocapsa_arctica.AAC.1
MNVLGGVRARVRVGAREMVLSGGELSGDGGGCVFILPVVEEVSGGFDPKDLAVIGDPPPCHHGSSRDRPEVVECIYDVLGEVLQAGLHDARAAFMCGDKDGDVSRLGVVPGAVPVVVG